MLIAEREAEILLVVNDRGAVTVHELAEQFGVTEATIRRDLTRLEAHSLLRRTHGGAVALQKSPELSRSILKTTPELAEYPNTDALIIAPVQNRAAHTLRERAIRNRIPLIAESSPQAGATYLGPRNYEATFELGRWAGQYIRSHMKHAAVLDITQTELANTRQRSAGFLAGLAATLDGDYPVLSVNGGALYNESYQTALDALRLHPEINVIFGINDDAILAGIQAYNDLGRETDRLLAVNVGGEGKTILDVLRQNGPLKACLALFPELVGRLAVDYTLSLWNGEPVEAEVITPSVLISAHNLGHYYTHTRQGWELNARAISGLLPERWQKTPASVRNRRLSFVIHYRTHEWYQNIARAMQERCRHLGVTLTVEDVNEDLKLEIRDLRRLIGKLAASYVNDGETIILDTGTTTASMAQFLRGYNHLTVITNSMDVFQQLRGEPGIKVILTGGEFDAESHSLIGRGAHLLLREIRADKVFIVAGGVSREFGISSVKAEEAEVRRSMIDAAREVIILADHTVLDTDSKVRATGLDAVHTLITDAGLLSSQSLELKQLGIKVIVAGQVTLP